MSWKKKMKTLIKKLTKNKIEFISFTFFMIMSIINTVAIFAYEANQILHHQAFIISGYMIEIRKKILNIPPDPPYTPVGDSVVGDGLEFLLKIAMMIAMVILFFIIKVCVHSVFSAMSFSFGVYFTIFLLVIFSVAYIVLNYFFFKQ